MTQEVTVIFLGELFFKRPLLLLNFAEIKGIP